MSILDDAIREHLELKRAHGADEAELKKLEDEAFGPPARPDEIDPFAEAPTQFMGVPEGAESPPGEGDAGRRVPNITDLQEPPPRSEAPEAEAQSEPPEAEAQAEAAETAVEPEPPIEEEQPAGEQALPEPQSPTEERQAIADQPTQFFDVEAVMESEPGAPADRPSPSDEDLVDAEMVEPRLAPVEDPGLVADEEDEDDDFFSEQRLSDELNQALEAPVTEEHAIEENALEPAPEPEPTPVDEVHEDDSEEHAAPPADSHQEGHEDVLEHTPDFLEDAPEDDNLWFEQRPPKDFDFDD